MKRPSELVLSASFATVGLVFVFSAVGCESVEVTPSRLESIADPDGLGDAALASWKEAVELMNDFLASDFNRSLPRGKYRFNDDVLEFAADGVVRPHHIRCSTWGDIVLFFGGKAQAVKDGIYVGARTGERNRVIDNSLFFRGDGSLRTPKSLAVSILHETAHIVHRCGSIGVWNTLLYGLEAVFLLRAASHSAERRPRATSSEFLYYHWWMHPGRVGREYVLEEFEKSLKRNDRMVEHGPYP